MEPKGTQHTNKKQVE